MQSFTRFFALLLTFLISTAVAADADFSFANNAPSLVTRAGTECPHYPCSDDATCEAYSCGHCMNSYCEPTESMASAASELAVAQVSASEAAAMMMPANTAAGDVGGKAFWAVGATVGMVALGVAGGLM